MDYTAQLIDLVDKPSWKMLLTEIVEKEHLDPWDIDIAQLTHSYIEHISNARKLDFRVPANAVLVSAILLRFKSDAWELYPQAAVEEQLENQSDWEFILEGKRVPELSFADCVSSMAATFKVVKSLTTGLPVDVPRVGTAD